MFCFAALAKIVARKFAKALIACCLKVTCKQDEVIKLLQKKVLQLTQIFFVLLAESVVAKNEEEYCADSFKPKGFPQKLSLPLSHMKLQ